MDRLRWLRTNWDRALGWVLVVAGGIVLFVGWDHVSETGYPAEQMPYLLSAGGGGVLLVALGATLLVSADLRDEWHKLDHLETRFERIERRLEAKGFTLDEVDDIEAPAVEPSGNGHAATTRRRVLAAPDR